MMITKTGKMAFGTLLLVVIAGAKPAAAQEEPIQPGRNAEVGGTEVGERQTREQNAANIEPVRRISNRVQNRVQNRIRNRIDRNYDPQANATSPFEDAAERTAAAGRRSQRR